MKNVYVADFSLALINRTGAYYVCRDVVERLSGFFVGIRYWRLFLKHEPGGMARRLLGRAMLFELQHMAGAGFHRSAGPSVPTLFFDPLYVLGAGVRPDDVVLCHDVGPLTHPELFEAETTALYQRAYEKIRDAGPGMVFVSHASAREFVSLFGGDFRFIRVIPLYVRDDVGQGEDKPPAGISGPFLLTVAAFEKRKNHRRCIEAFERTGLHERGYSYVLCGPRGNAGKEIAALAKAAPGVVALGYQPDCELRWLYRNASGFVLPSLLEGFGLPALEAGAHGLISLVSAGTAQTEAVGQGAIAVNPLSVSSIAEGMRRLVGMPDEEREARLELVPGQLAALSFEKYLARWERLLSSQGERTE